MSPPKSRTYPLHTRKDILNFLKSKSNMPQKTFHPFSRLPTELRLQIWTHALPGPRVLETNWSVIIGRWFCVGESRSLPSALPLTNREAREVFFEHYTRFCWSRSTHVRKAPTYLPSYIDPSIDTLFIGANYEEDYGHEMTYRLLPALQVLLEKFPIVLEVKHLAFEISLWHQKVHVLRDFDTKYKKEKEVIGFFPKSEVLTIADYDIDENWLSRGKKRRLGEIEFVEPTQMDLKNEDEMWIVILKRFNEMRKAGMKLPKTDLKEVLRGGVLSTFT